MALDCSENLDLPTLSFGFTKVVKTGCLLRWKKYLSLNSYAVSYCACASLTNPNSEYRDYVKLAAFINRKVFFIFYFFLTTCGFILKLLSRICIGLENKR